MVNRRPLTAVASTPDDLRALSPNDFIFPYPARTGLPTVKPNQQNFDMKEMKAVIFSEGQRYVQNILEDYWKRFNREILTFLKKTALLETVANYRVFPRRSGSPTRRKPESSIMATRSHRLTLRRRIDRHRETLLCFEIGERKDDQSANPATLQVGTRTSQTGRRKN